MYIYSFPEYNRQWTRTNIIMVLQPTRNGSSTWHCRRENWQDNSPVKTDTCEDIHVHIHIIYINTYNYAHVGDMYAMKHNSQSSDGHLMILRQLVEVWAGIFPVVWVDFWVKSLSLPTQENNINSWHMVTMYNIIVPFRSSNICLSFTDIQW